MAANNDLIYALDIGTRCVVGVVGTVEGDRVKVLDIELAEHSKRAMIDGQIDNIQQVGELARTVTRKLEERLDTQLQHVCVAAAGRALRTGRGSFLVELEEGKSIDAELISSLEAGAVFEAEQVLQIGEDIKQQFFLVGYTVSQYRLDGYPLTALLGHSGKRVEVDVVATFLPGEVVESLYAAMRAAELQVVSITLEPIAAMNTAIPAELRMLNLALVDIGAGTTDIAVCKDGSVVGYTMATIAGDEITEALMQVYLLDFQTAEQVKRGLKKGENSVFTDILGLEQTFPCDEVLASIEPAMNRLAEAIALQIISVNDMPPSAVFLAGGGSKLDGLRELVAEKLNLDERRVGIAGNNFAKSVFSDTLEIANPEYTTPLGIAISAGMGLLNDSYTVMLNGAPAKLFRSGVLSLRDVLLMNGYNYSDMLGGTGQNINITVDGKPVTLRGEPSVPAVLRLNNKDAAINAPVHAGDRIQFIPAKKGADAKKTLGDLLGSDFRGHVLVNNEERPMDTYLKQGDVVLTLKVAAPPHSTVQTKAQEAGVGAVTSVGAGAVTGAVTSVGAGAVTGAEQPAETPVVKQSPKPINIILNDRPITLYGKDNEQPYYLMDMLELSGIDFKHLDRPVQLLVNGRESGFREVIKDSDSVVIRCI